MTRPLETQHLTGRYLLVNPSRPVGPLSPRLPARSPLFTSTGVPGGSAGREPTCQLRRCEFNPSVGKMPWRRKRPRTPVFLPGRVHGQGAWRGVGYKLAKSQTWLSD